jgi:hypothetical protein
MKTVLCGILGLFLFLLTASGEESLILKRIEKPPESIEEVFFRATKSRVEIDKPLISRIQLGIEEGKSHAQVIVGYKNKTSDVLRPAYTLRLYNPYGMLMSYTKVPLADRPEDKAIRPGATGAKVLRPRIYRLESIFRYSSLKEYPADFFQVAWLSLSTNNKIVEQGGAGQPATVPESKSEGKETPKPESEARPQ